MRERVEFEKTLVFTKSKSSVLLFLKLVSSKMSLISTCVDLCSISLKHSLFLFFLEPLPTYNYISRVPLQHVTG